MSASALPPPPVGPGLGLVHLALAAVGSSALTGLILVLSFAGRTERLGGEVERSVRRGIEGGVEQALAPDRVRDTSAAAGRGLVGGVVDGALDQVGGERGEALASGAVELGLEAVDLGFGAMDALVGPIEPRAEQRLEACASDVAAVDSEAPVPAPVPAPVHAPGRREPRSRGLAQDAGALTGEAVELGLDVMQDLLGVTPRAQAPVPEDTRDPDDR